MDKLQSMARKLAALRSIAASLEKDLDREPESDNMNDNDLNRIIIENFKHLSDKQKIAVIAAIEAMI